MSIKLDMVGIVTRDLGRSLEFYRTLGLPIPEADLGEPYVEFKQENGLRISWNKLEMIRDIVENWVEPVGNRLGIAFLCQSPAAVDDTHRRIVEAGFASEKAPWDAFWGQRYAMVRDPDGNSIDLFAPLG